MESNLTPVSSDGSFVYLDSNESSDSEIYDFYDFKPAQLDREHYQFKTTSSFNCLDMLVVNKNYNPNSSITAPELVELYEQHTRLKHLVLKSNHLRSMVNTIVTNSAPPPPLESDVYKTTLQQCIQILKNRRSKLAAEIQKTIQTNNRLKDKIRTTATSLKQSQLQLMEHTAKLKETIVIDSLKIKKLEIMKAIQTALQKQHLSFLKQLFNVHMYSTSKYQLVASVVPSNIMQIKSHTDFKYIQIHLWMTLQLYAKIKSIPTIYNVNVSPATFHLTINRNGSPKVYDLKDPENANSILKHLTLFIAYLWHHTPGQTSSSTDIKDHTQIMTNVYNLIIK